VQALLAAATPAAGWPAHKEPFTELRDRWHRTALSWAVVNGHVRTATALVAAGAAVNGVRSATSGKPMRASRHAKATTLPLETPLHAAARLPLATAVPMTRLLLEAGADPALCDQFGRAATRLMPAELAAELGRLGLGCGDERQAVCAT